jgi:hypothetical protein
VATYTPQPGDSVIPGAQAATELLSPVGGFIAGCGQASLLVIAHLVNGTPISASEVTTVIRDSTTHGASATGVSTPSQLMATANDLGTPLQSVQWQTALAQDAGVTPIELGVGNARAFGGADRNIAGHYVTVVGRTAQGNYIVSDPNTQASLNGGFVAYTPGQIAAAQPFWAAIPQASSTIGGAFGGLNEAAIAGGISSGLQNAASVAGHGLLGGVGVKSLPDLLWRIGLVLVGVLVVLLAVAALSFDEGGQQAAQAAPVVMEAAT